MVSSMTGYGSGKSQLDGVNFSVEIKSVNSRYCDIYIKTPKHLSFLEEIVKKEIKKRINRGKINIILSYELTLPPENNVKVDKSIIKNYINIMEEIKDDFKIDDKLNVYEILSLPQVIEVKEDEIEEAKLIEALLPALEEAIENLMKMRNEEGKTLIKSLLSNLDLIKNKIDGIKEKSKSLVENYREKLHKRINQIIKSKELDEERLEQEVIIYAEKSDINEEIVRINSHIKQFIDCLNDTKPVGRKLDFISQEINREINTIGSKANDISIAKFVIDIKSELEKIREQIQNIE